jgi:hypothetical protein
METQQEIDCRFRRAQLAPPLSASNASEDSGVKENPVFFIVAFYQD